MAEKGNSQEETEKKKEPTIPDWAIWAGVGAVVTGATIATVYYVKKKRDEELEIMRYGQAKQHTPIFDFSSVTSRFVKFWGWTTEGLNKINVYINGFVTKPATASPLTQEKGLTGNLDSDTDDTNFVASDAEL